ncbi:holo-ACP synthase [Geoalkalibacter halelectricus]|uniref:Holo-[acyl-carrier-protein] synthase n=1 Tax=Geoalkalibacter halelectricus TaxID=2847045 RepID=A0ABY5ZK84_9BACT|nr:holo-ACP synthase [Geoalkalibacter halelectricus]MDO3379128.1 holo-ACP synthase [Geoalkalibacter halelectricus]UWZ79013.1 holo-ACP synthase [Geoalkalibacter halelectricus]
MAVAGIGTDLARISRFRRLVEEEKHGVLERIFTAGERGYALEKKDPAPHLAARFAAKEAFLKALGLGLRQGLRWQDMEVVRDELGKPSLRLSGQAEVVRRERGIQGVHLSYSHDGDYASAVVVLETP